MDLQDAAIFQSVFSTDSHVYVAAVLLTTGILTTAMFSITSGPKQVMYAVPACVALGFGSIYTLAAAGVGNQSRDSMHN